MLARRANTTSMLPQSRHSKANVHFNVKFRKRVQEMAKYLNIRWKERHSIWN